MQMRSFTHGEEAAVIGISKRKWIEGEINYLLTPSPSPDGRRESLRFWAMTNTGRHLGVFPEVAAHWDGRDLIVVQENNQTYYNLFGYTGLATPPRHLRVQK